MQSCDTSYPRRGKSYPDTSYPDTSYLPDARPYPDTSYLRQCWCQGSFVGGKFEPPEACPRHWQGFKKGGCVFWKKFEPPEACPRRWQGFIMYYTQYTQSSRVCFPKIHCTHFQDFDNFQNGPFEQKSRRKCEKCFFGDYFSKTISKNVYILRYCEED